MAFKDTLPTDMAKLLDTDYFAQSVTYIATSGEQTSLTVVLFEEATETPESNGIKTKLRFRECTWSTATLDTVNIRAKIRISGEDWAISRVVYRDATQITVRLERHELHEHTRPEFRRR